MKIIKQGKIKIKNTLYIHKCSYCKTKFIYDLEEEAILRNGKLYIMCPLCQEKEPIVNFLGIGDRKYRKVKNIYELNKIKKEDK